MDTEIFPALRVAGIDGQVDALLSDKSLLLERSDGKGMRIELDTIVRLRHHHVAITPPLLTLFGVLAVVASFRVLDGRPQVYAFILGAAAILFWALGRRPALCIDTRQGDRHILYGRDHRLQRLYIMIDRMSEGATLEEARLGLDELQQPEFLPIGNIDDIQHELQSVEAAEAQLAGGVSETSLEEALASIRERKDDAFATNGLVYDAEVFSDNGTPAIGSSTSETTSVTAVSPTEVTDEIAISPSPSEQGFPQGSMYDRASRALHEQREPTPQAGPSYDSPFQTPSEIPVPSDESAYERCWGRTDPKWYEERGEEAVPISRAESAAKEASEANFDTGGMFGIFDQVDDMEDSVVQQHPTTSASPGHPQPEYPPAASPGHPQPAYQPAASSYTGGHAQPSSTLPVHQPQRPPWEQSEQTPTSSYSMLSEALGSGNALPEPTREALRAGLPVSSGLVESARVATPQTPQPRPLTRQPKYAHQVEQPVLEEYPALSRMHRQSVTDSRLRLNRGRMNRRRGAMSVLGEWVRPGLKRLEKKGREFTKLIVGESSYSETYGDEDGNEGDQFLEAELRSDQILRLRADQDAQSDVAERLRLLTRNGGGAIADDLASRTLKGISDSARQAPLILEGDEEKKLEAPPSFDKMLCTSDPVPGFGGMRRLG